MGKNDVTRDGVIRAVREFDKLGEKAFFEKYRFGSAKYFFLHYNGRAYPSKAIFGVAHGYSAEGLSFLSTNDFSGGDAQVAEPLRKLGFKVSGERRSNPKWTRDELILALDFYLRWNGNPPGKTSRELIELSDQINRVAAILGIFGGEKFRNVNGVYMKLMNLRRFDARYISAGKSGLQSGGKLEEEIWAEFANRPAALAAGANAIMSGLLEVEAYAETEPSFELDPDFQEAEEGMIVTRVHRRRERSRKLVSQKKTLALQEFGQLRCEACEFDFEKFYGDRGTGFMECHHTVPVSEMVSGQKTSLADLALLCSNCHRMIHSSRPWLTVAELRDVIFSQS